LNAPMSGPRLAEFDQAVHEQVLAGHITGLAIWNADGQRVYAGGAAAAEPGAVRAEARISALAGAAGAILDDGAGGGPAAVTVYAPLMLADGTAPAGVVALTRVDAAAAEQQSETRRNIVMALG